MKTTARPLRRREKEQLKGQAGNGQTEEKARHPTVDCHSEAEGCQGCHGD